MTSADTLNQSVRLLVPPVSVIAGPVAAMSADALAGIGVFLAGSFIAGWVSRSWWCAAILFAGPMALLVYAVTSSWPAAQQDGVAAMVVVVRSVAFFVAIAVGSLLGGLGTHIASNRNGHQRREPGRTTNVGQ
jgi:hypothetical protein